MLAFGRNILLWMLSHCEYGFWTGDGILSLFRREPFSSIGILIKKRSKGYMFHSITNNDQKVLIRPWKEIISIIFTGLRPWANSFNKDYEGFREGGFLINDSLKYCWKCGAK